MTSLRQLGEFALIRAIQKRIRSRDRSVLVGIGDDCAVLRGDDPDKVLLYTCDPVVERIHFRPNTPPRRVGWKAMARNLSDIAAMGGLPRWAIVSLGLRRSTSLHDVEQLYDGLQAAAQEFGCTIVGGDTTRVPREQFVVVSMLGEVETNRLVLRSGGRVGDSVFVTGMLGGSLRGKHLTFMPRIAEARWLSANFHVHTMIDVSDGLSSDLRRLVEANNAGIGFEIFAAEVPIARAARGSLHAALNDGEDFELLFTLDPRDVTRLRRAWVKRFKLPLTEIGRVVRSRGKVTLISREGTKQVLPAKGYDHFASAN